MEGERKLVKGLVSCLVPPPHPHPVAAALQGWGRLTCVCRLRTWTGRDTEIQEGERIITRSVLSRRQEGRRTSTQDGISFGITEESKLFLL